MFATILTGCNQGLIWAILALGVFVSYRLLDFADLTCEGSFTCGAAVAAALIYNGVNSIVAIVIAFLAGIIAGTVTGVLHTKLKIPPILAGILTMIALWSINISVMSLATGNSATANLSLLTVRDNLIYNGVLDFFNIPIGLKNYTSLGIGVIICCVVIAFLYWFFGTEIGSSIRATGVNANMCRAQGINTDATKIMGLALSNGLIATSGALIAQYQSYADVSMGVGAIVIGLASIIIGETLFSKAKGFFLKLVGIAVGSVVYRIVVTLVIFWGVPSTYLKLMTACIVAVALALPVVQRSLRERSLRRKKTVKEKKPKKPLFKRKNKETR